MIGYDGDTWVFYFWFVGWHCLSLGFHLDVSRRPCIELHVPFGFIRIGRQKSYSWYGPGLQFRKNMNMGVGSPFVSPALLAKSAAELSLLPEGLEE